MLEKAFLIKCKKSLVSYELKWARFLGILESHLMQNNLD